MRTVPYLFYFHVFKKVTIFTQPRPYPLKRWSKNSIKKWSKYELYDLAWAFVSIKSSFFYMFFTLFSIFSGNYDGFGGIRISSLILIFGRHLSNRPLKIRGYQKSHFWFFWRAFLLQILLIFEDITELYMLRPLLGRTIDQKTEIRNYFLRVLVAQKSCKIAPNHLGGDQKIKN